MSHLNGSIKPGTQLKRNAKVVVIPAKLGSNLDLDLPDAIATDLLGRGLHIVERTALKQLVESKGFDYLEILNGQQYVKIGTATDISCIVLVNSHINSSTSIIQSASARVLNPTTGELYSSVTFENPQPDNSTYIGNQGLTETAKRMSAEIMKCFEK